jgi:hypothetical protein
MRWELRHGLALLALGVAAAWGCSGDDGSDSPLLACPAADGGTGDPCCTPCEGTLGEVCSPVMSFPNQARTRQEWKDFGEVRIVAGACSEGTRFLAMSNGFFSDTRYFDGSGQFIGLRRSSDFDPVCSQPYRYFPAPVSCQAPMVSEVILDEPDPR